MTPALIERVIHHPASPPEPAQRLQAFHGVIRNFYSDEELALKRKHGRLIQSRLHAGVSYAAEAQATAQPVEPDYEQ